MLVDINNKIDKFLNVGGKIMIKEKNVKMYNTENQKIKNTSKVCT